MGDNDDPGLEAAVVNLTRWAAGARAEAAADSRVRQQWAQQQAEDEATLASLLVGLAEHQTAVALRASSGSILRGTVAGLGVDYVALVHGHQLSLVPWRAIEWLRPDHAPGPATFADRAEIRGRFVGVLASLAAEGSTVRVVAGTEALAGDLLAVGEDVLTLRPSGAAADQLVYVPVASVSEASLRLSG
jgi:hypothetical protein